MKTFTAMQAFKQPSLPEKQQNSSKKTEILLELAAQLLINSNKSNTSLKIRVFQKFSLMMEEVISRKLLRLNQRWAKLAT